MACGSPNQKDRPSKWAARLSVRARPSQLSAAPGFLSESWCGLSIPLCNRSGHGCKVMDASAKDNQLGDVWNWVVIGLVDAAVTAALFVPYIWELTRAG
jgi:hypothetical protein